MRYTVVLASNPEKVIAKLESNFTPVPGSLLSAYNTSVYDDMVIYAVELKHREVVIGSRVFYVQDAPILDIDLHLKTVTCRRCQKVDIFELLPITEPTSMQIDFETIYDGVVDLYYSHHDECQPYVCPN